ncbi:MAG: ATP-binding cassette domain-containing protein, partial [Ignavibacteria bacterium]|nr:ATP-binding cassette domain-containing protein [Ignavibacteria bacterium]
EIGYMPQIGRYPENMNVEQVFTLMKEVRKKFSDKYDEELIDAFNLRNQFKKTIKSLSGGTRQKVSACIAFLFDTSVLILDEPTAGLDPLSSELLKKKIQDEIKRGKLILITSHVLSDLDEIINEVMYLQDGKIRFHKSITELIKETGTEKLSKAIAQFMKLNATIN